MAEEKKTNKQTEKQADKPAASQAAQPAAAATDSNGGVNKEPQLRILRQYVKDLSFENPQATEVEGWGDKQPEIGINLEVKRQNVSEGTWEVTLKLTARATVEQNSVFLAEVLYGGLMQVENVPQESLDAVISIEGPRQMFPFARRILADMVRDGGFPSLLLSPVDFTQLYRLGQSQAQAQAQAQAE